MSGDDDLEMKIESARWRMEDYVNFTLHGTKHHKVDSLRDGDIQEPVPDWRALRRLHGITRW
jgi:hypothetical protein